MPEVDRRPKGKVFRGYKVLLAIGTRLWSCVIGAKGGRNEAGEKRFRAKYTTGRWIVPHPDCGPLCVFTTYGAAERFFPASVEAAAVNKRIVPCKYVQSNDTRIYVKGYRRTYHLYELPEQTALASAVRLDNLTKGEEKP